LSSELAFQNFYLEKRAGISEFLQRRVIVKGLHGAREDDIVLISDVDERFSKVFSLLNVL